MLQSLVEYYSILYEWLFTLNIRGCITARVEPEWKQSFYDDICEALLEH